MKNILGFNFSHIRGDIFGGITAGIVALPLALAFGLQSGLGASAGFYGAIFISFFAALFGGTNTQISGPTAPMTAVSMVIIAGIVATNEGDLEKAIPAILMVFILAGLLQILFGFLKIGQYIRYIPYPVVSGFMTGIGVIILVTQLLPLLGYYPKEDIDYVNKFKPLAEEVILGGILKDEVASEILVLEDFDETLRRAKLIKKEEIMRQAQTLATSNASGVIGSLRMAGRTLRNMNPIDLSLGLLTIAIIFGFRKITTKIPSTLVALLVVSSGAFFFIGDYRTIGNIPNGFPIFRIDIFTGFSFSQIQPYFLTAVSLAALGTIDSLLTSVVADNMTKTKHNPNKELVGQGIGNIIAALFGGIPGAGATVGTVVNIKSGGKTKLSGMIAGLLLLFILLSLGTLASKIPAAVLAGILISVGIRVMDYKGLRHIGQMPKTEVFVMLLVLGLTVFTGLIEAVLIGLILSSVLFMKKISDVIDKRTTAAPLASFSRELTWEDEDGILEMMGDRVYIKHLYGPLFFGFASRFQDMIKALPDISVVIMRMSRVPYVDQSGLYAMEDAINDLHALGIKVVFVDLHGQPADMFDRLNVAPGLVEEKFLFENFKSCLKWLGKYLEKKEIQKKSNIRPKPLKTDLR